MPYFIFFVPFLLLMFVPWLALLVIPLGVWAVSGAMIVANLGGFPAVPAVEAVRSGLLMLKGLEVDPWLAELVRGAIGRTLELAPAGSNATACACVKQTGRSYVGVVRIWNSDGHFVMRQPGDSVSAVATSIVDGLNGLDGRFPATRGMRRAQVHECDPRTCPIRQMHEMHTSLQPA